MRRQEAMRRQGMCRHNASSGGPGTSPMCRHNASSGGNVSSGGNASSGNASSQCVVRG